MIADIVKNLAPKNLSSYQMMASGIDPHTYKPLARDLRRLQKADAILYNGFYLEASLTKILTKLPQASPICENIPAKYLLQGDYNLPDPHLWMDIKLWQLCVLQAKKILQSYFPQDSSSIEENANQYLTELTALEKWARQEIATLPREKRILVTAHDAFRYFGRAYGFDVRGIQGISTASEAGIKDIQKLANFVVAKKVPAIFVENSVARHNIIALKEAILAKDWKVKIGNSLYSDSMGPKGSGKDNYQAMMRHNISSIVSALNKK